MIRRFIAALVLTAASVLLAAPAPIDRPLDPVCNVPGSPPCAPPPDPAMLCAVIAWRTFTPCNWYGVQVPQGTPGSWG